MDVLSKICEANDKIVQLQFHPLEITDACTSFLGNYEEKLEKFLFKIINKKSD